MTINRRIVFSLDEIKALVLECAKPGCGKRVVSAIDDPNLPERCICGQEWFLLKPPASASMNPTSPLKDMASSFANLLIVCRNTSPGVRVLFEINEPQ